MLPRVSWYLSYTRIFIDIGRCDSSLTGNTNSILYYIRIRRNRARTRPSRLCRPPRGRTNYSLPSNSRTTRPLEIYYYYSIIIISGVSTAAWNQEYEGIIRTKVDYHIFTCSISVPHTIIKVPEYPCTISGFYPYFRSFRERETGAKFAVKSNTFSRLSRWHISKTSAHLALENLCA